MSTVIVEPPMMVTASPDPGTTPPDHEPVALQFPPEPVLLMLAAPTADASPSNRMPTQATLGLNPTSVRAFFRDMESLWKQNGAETSHRRRRAGMSPSFFEQKTVNHAYTLSYIRN
jgi:hypothetical protein